MNGQVVYGQTLFDAGQYERSAATFTKALALDPENLIALRHLGDIARLNGDATGAMEWYQRVLDADPRNAEIIGYIETLKAAVEFSPPASGTTPVANRLETADTLGRGMDQVVDLNASAAPVIEGETGPRPQVFVTETMAELYLAQGFRDEALKVYKQLAAQHPDDTSLRDRVVALERGGRASISFEKFAADEPGLASAGGFEPLDLRLDRLTPDEQSARDFFAALEQQEKQ